MLLLAYDKTASQTRTLKVGGLVPFSTADYPGKLAAVVFVQGCPWQCAYCHNPHLQPRTEQSPLPWEEVTAMLRRRKGLLDAVVFSGGEPTLDPALPNAMREVRELGFQIGLHTGGAYPKRLAELLPLLDWIGFDAKAPFDEYERITGVADSGVTAMTSAHMIMNSGVEHEFRTTIHPDLISEEELIELAQRLAAMGVKHYSLQLFREQGCDNPALLSVDRMAFPGDSVIWQMEKSFERFTLRGG